MNKKILILFLFIVTLVVLLTINFYTVKTAKPTVYRTINVGILIGSGGLGDHAFNDSAYAGLLEAKRKYNIRFEIIPFSSTQVNLDEMRRLCRQGYDLIIDVGTDDQKLIATLAQEFPQVKFALVDATLSKNVNNVVSIVWREQEGDFLMGVLAASLTKSKKVGFIGGTDIEIIRRIASGFKQGVVYQNRNVAVVSDISGSWSDTEIGKTLAKKQYQSGVDVIYQAAGRTGLGVIQAAKELNRLTLGTSGDQRYLAPNNMVGNRPKRVDTAILIVVKEIVENNFQPGNRSLGLKENGLAFGPFNESLVSTITQKRLNDLKQKIINGEIIVTVPQQ
jgi:basic membrane protein A